MPFLEQMAQIGSEAGRALRWQLRNRPEQAGRAFERALELWDFTLEAGSDLPKLREAARSREAFAADFIGGGGEAVAAAWERYFLPFAYAVRRKT